MDEEQRKQAEKEAGISNPWERVLRNCELNKDLYVGDKDVTRMRESMISRKNDKQI